MIDTATVFDNPAAPTAPLIIGLLAALTVIVAWALVHPDPGRRSEGRAVLALLISGWRGR